MRFGGHSYIWYQHSQVGSWHMHFRMKTHQLHAVVFYANGTDHAMLEVCIAIHKGLFPAKTAYAHITDLHHNFFPGGLLLHPSLTLHLWDKEFNQVHKTGVLHAVLQLPLFSTRSFRWFLCLRNQQSHRHFTLTVFFLLCTLNPPSIGGPSPSSTLPEEGNQHSHGL